MFTATYACMHPYDNILEARTNQRNSGSEEKENSVIIHIVRKGL